MTTAHTQKRVFSEYEFEMFSYDVYINFSSSKVTLLKFKDGLIELNPKQVEHRYELMNPHSISEMCYWRECPYVLENLTFLPKLEEITITNILSDFDLTTIKPILQSSTIDTVNLIPFQDAKNFYFRFSKAFESQQLQKKFERKIYLHAICVNGVNILNFNQYMSKGYPA
ncbi:unnamed protein product [Ambrosiozyma monospora]|uniref:Unnamed protein product n=1 Tax=Ambrosiozyma monospora TaxID=43982 RepID=A0ACB5TSE2_AMBMO|nr:unnamed protein product [Ambrosiozyma monospora]